MNDPQNELERAARDLIDHPVIPPTPVAELQRRAAADRRRRVVQVAAAAMVIVVVGASIVAVSRARTDTDSTVTVGGPLPPGTTPAAGPLELTISWPGMSADVARVVILGRLQQFGATAGPLEIPSVTGVGTVQVTGISAADAKLLLEPAGWLYGATGLSKTDPAHCSLTISTGPGMRAVQFVGWPEPINDNCGYIAGGLVNVNGPGLPGSVNGVTNVSVSAAGTGSAVTVAISKDMGYKLGQADACAAGAISRTVGEGGTAIAVPCHLDVPVNGVMLDDAVIAGAAAGLQPVQPTQTGWTMSGFSASDAKVLAAIIEHPAPANFSVIRAEPSPPAGTSTTAMTGTTGPASQVSLLVTAGSIPRGMSADDAVNQGLIVSKSIDRQYAPQTAVGSIAELGNGVAVFPIAPGTLIVEGMFVDQSPNVEPGIPSGTAPPVAVPIPAGMLRADWVFDNPTDPADNAFIARINYSGCSRDNRVQDPIVVETDEAIVVTFFVTDAGGCQPAFSDTRKVQLSRPIGTRRFYDGGKTPPAEVPR